MLSMVTAALAALGGARVHVRSVAAPVAAIAALFGAAYAGPAWAVTEADLSVTVSDSPDPVQAGSNLTYTITLANNGPDSADNTALTDTLPAGLTFVSFNQDAGPAFTCATGGSITCTIASIPAGTSAVLTLVGTVDGGIGGAVLSNTAVVSSTTSDPNAANDTSTATTTVTAPEADLSVTISDSPDPVQAGSNVTFTINLSNNGPDAADSTSLSVPLPAGAAFVSLSAPAGFSCTTPAVGGVGTVTCTHASFAAGASGTFTLVAASPGATGILTTTASASSATSDSNAANNTATANTVVVAAVPSLTAVSPGVGPAAGGTTVTITGSNFTGATAVTFDNVAATSFSVNSDTSITAVTPAGSGMVAVAVTTGAGTDASGAFTYLSPPTVVVDAPAGPLYATDDFDVTFTINNPNATALNDVTFSWNQSPGLTFVAATPSQGSVVGSSVELGTLAANGSASVVVSYDANTTGTVLILGLASAADAGTGTQSSDSLDLLAPVDVNVAVQASSTTVVQGDTVTYTITAMADAFNPAVNVVVTDVLPAGVTFASLTAPAGWACTTPAVGAGGTITCTAATLGSFATAEFSLIGTVDPAATGTISNTATVSADSTDITPANNTATATVSIVPPAPVASNGSLSVGYQASADLTLSASGSVTSYAIATGPAHGSVSVEGAVATYTAAEGYFGADSFTFAATGPGGTSPPATVTVSVATPAAPGAAAVSANVSYNSPGTLITLQPDGVYTTVALGDGPQHGTVLFEGSTVTYVPAAGYFGADSFTYTATGPGGTSAAATVSVTVATPAAPGAAAVTANVDYNSSGEAITLEPDGVYTTVAIVTQPQHGSVTLEGTTATYTPSTGYHGEDSFTYAAAGPGGTSAAATVSITVGAPPAPGATALTAEVDYNSAGEAITLLPDGVYTSVSLASEPEHGSVTLEGTTATYVPASGYFGADSFTYTATGPGGTSAAGVVSITVGNPAAPTVTSPDPLDLTISQANPHPTATIDLSQQASGVFTEITVASEPEHGVVSVTTTAQGAGQPPLVVATYDPTDDYVGADSFTFVASGPGGTSTEATVTINIAGTTPVLAPLTATTPGGVMVSVNLTATADEGPFSAAAIVSVSPQGSGTATLVEGGTAGDRTYQLEFEPTGAFTGQSVVTYTLSNRFGASAAGTVTITVTPRPNPAADPDVNGLVDAQAETVRRFASTQIENFMRRMESLHGEGAGAQANSLRFAGVSDVAMPNLDGPFPGLTARRQSEEERDAWFLRTPQMQTADGAGGGGAGPAINGPVKPWAAGVITFGRRNGGSGRAELDVLSTGLSAGVDVRLSDSATLGGGFGFGRDITDVGDAGSRVEAKNWVGTVYGSFQPLEAIFVDGVLGAGELSFDLERHVAASGDIATAERDGDLLFASVTGSFEHHATGWLISSYGRLEGSRADLAAYSESGAGMFNLTYDEREVRSLLAAAGVRGQFTHEVRGSLITPRLRLELQHEFEDESGQLLQYADWLTGPTYLISGQGWVRDRLQAGLGVSAALQDGWTVDFEAETQLGDDLALGSIRLKAGRQF